MTAADVTLKEFNSPSQPQYKWVVYWPNEKPGQRRLYKRFPTKKAASAWQNQKIVEILNGGRDSAAVHDRAVKEASWAMKQLGPYDVSIREVVEDYLERKKAVLNSLKVQDALWEILEAKEKDGLPARYVADLRSRLGNFAKTFGERFMADISTKEVAEWLRARKVHATTRNNDRRALVVFFSWGVDMGYVPTNPVSRVPQARTKDSPVEIFTPGQLRIILDNAPADVLPVLAIGAFAGLRSSEIERLDWSEINFLKDHIEVTAAKSKTASRRFAPLNSSLKKWLKPLAKSKGPVAPANMAERLWKYHLVLAKKDKEKKRPAVKWIDNGLRHSFASYSIAQEEDAARVALWLGHTDARITFRHYQERATTDEAAEWFEIVPRKGKKIVGMRKAS